MAWLDGEIAAAQKVPTTEKKSALAPSLTPAVVVASKPVEFADAAAAERAAEKIIAQYQQGRESLQSTVKRGCFLYFFIAFALLGAGVLALYLFRTR